MAEYRIVPIQRADLTATADADDIEVTLGAATTHFEIINMSTRRVLATLDGGANWTPVMGVTGRDVPSPGSPNSQVMQVGTATTLHLRGLWDIRDLSMLTDTAIADALQVNVIPQIVILNELVS